MEFSYLECKINQLIEFPLPGINLHRELSPIKRPLFTKYTIPKTAKKAGVLILIYPDIHKKATLLLTKRAQYNGTHSKQISFPGGKKNEEDVNLKNTALRETFEEVGITTNDINIVKQLSTIYIPPSNFKVDSFIGIATYTPIFTKNYEVQELIHLPISELLDNNNLTTFKTSTSYAKNVNVPCFMFQKHCVWGATGMILNELKEVLKNL